MKNKKGFTLIELLAVIIILGILITIAVIGITRYINESRRNIYVNTGKTYIQSVRNYANSGWGGKGINLYDTEVTYYIPEKCIPMEKGNRSPNGTFKEAYVVLVYDAYQFNYYWMSRDNTNTGFTLISEEELDKDKISNNMTELIPNIGIDGRGKILVLNNECNLEGVSEINASYLLHLDGESTTSSKTLGVYTTIWSDLDKTKVERVKMESSIIIPTNAIKSWDVSVGQDKSVMAWYTDTDNNGLYELYIASNGKIYGNSNSSYLFLDFTNVKKIELSNFDTSKVTNMGAMFHFCENLMEVDVSNFDTSKVLNMNAMFSRCYKLKNLDVSRFNTSKVTNMSYMFLYCYELQSLDVSNFNTMKVINMGAMFYDCHLLTNLNVSNFNTSQVTSMRLMFGGVKNIKTLDLSNFDTSKVSDIEMMFYNCLELINLNISNFNTSQVTNMKNMFRTCPKLTNIDLRNFDTSKVTTMFGMFRYNTGLQNIDLSSFDIKSTTDLTETFLNINSNVVVKVKNNEIRDLIKAKYPTLNVIV